ncbi:hypothetical protein WMF26_16310 [Sorangium sp. So ce185]|uniref:hypothetical protein n=1 Tax=Sorangium sp. So ce185 TaxID=3133287 RepID=UPI003F6276AE
MLLARLIASDSGPAIRAAVEASSSDKSRHRGSPADVVRRLSDRERLQLLMTIPTSTLWFFIDQIVTTGTIKISAHETRRPKHVIDFAGSQAEALELSSLGVRRVTRTPIIKLATKVWRVYDANGKSDDLAWRLSRKAVKASRGAVLARLGTSDPYSFVKDIILPSAEVTTALATELDMDISLYPEGSTTNALLWKFGFAIPRFEDTYSSLRKRLQHFQDTILRIGRISSETDREAIRSAGVNLFVSAEAFLNELISFNVWLLYSDHFLRTKFIFRNQDACESVGGALGHELGTGSQTIKWDAGGSNTLGVLSSYLSAAAKWISGRASAPTGDVMRPVSDFPHYRNSGDRPFAFNHVQFWADADREALESYAADFAKVVNELGQANLAYVRNGLDHTRTEETFPSIDSMLLCVTRLREAFDIADSRRLIPKSFWLRSRQQDRYGRIEYEYEDYAGRGVKLIGPPGVAGLPTIPDEVPVIIAPGSLLPEAGTDIRFILRSNSAYDLYWSGYPRRARPEARDVNSDTSVSRG